MQKAEVPDPTKGRLLRLPVAKSGIRLRLKDLYRATRHSDHARKLDSCDFVCFQTPFLNPANHYHLFEVQTRYDARVLCNVISCATVSSDWKSVSHQNTLSVAHLTRTCPEWLSVYDNLQTVYRYFKLWFEFSEPFSNIIETLRISQPASFEFLSRSTGQIAKHELARLIAFVGSYAKATQFVIDLDELELPAASVTESFAIVHFLERKCVFVSRRADVLESLQKSLNVVRLDTFESRLESHSFSTQPTYLHSDTEFEGSRSTLSKTSQTLESYVDKTIDLPATNFPSSLESLSHLEILSLRVSGSTAINSSITGGRLPRVAARSTDILQIECRLAVPIIDQYSDIFVLVNPGVGLAIEKRLNFHAIDGLTTEVVQVGIQVDVSQIRGDNVGVAMLVKHSETGVPRSRVTKIILIERVLEELDSLDPSASILCRLELVPEDRSET